MAGEAGDGRGRRDPVAKAFAVLKWMVDQGGETCGVRELAAALGVSASTAHRVLAVLECEGVVERHEDGRYRVGLELLRLSAATMSRFGIQTRAMPILRELADATGETALFSRYDRARMQMIYVAWVPSPHPLHYVVTLNEWKPIDAGASGLGILAFLSPEERRAVMAKRIRAETPATITDPEELERFLEEVRSKGYALTHGQRTSGAVGISAPVWDADGRVAGAAIVTLPEQRFDAARAEEYAQLVRDAGERISALFASRPAHLSTRPDES